MKTLILSALNFLFSVTASAAPSCNLAKLPKITGLDYHTARAMLINAGHVPCIEPDLPQGIAGIVGYKEGSFPYGSPARITFTFKNFTVQTVGAENIDLPNSQIVESVQCTPRKEFSFRQQDCPRNR